MHTQNIAELVLRAFYHTSQVRFELEYPIYGEPTYVMSSSGSPQDSVFKRHPQVACCVGLL